MRSYERLNYDIVVEAPSQNFREERRDFHLELVIAGLLVLGGRLGPRTPRGFVTPTPSPPPPRLDRSEEYAHAAPVSGPQRKLADLCWVREELSLPAGGVEIIT